MAFFGRTSSRDGAASVNSTHAGHCMLVQPSNVLGRLFAQPFTATFLGAVLDHDYETHRHLLNVGALAARVALAAGFADDDATEVAHAALFHDIGKISVRRSLLSARGPLSPTDWSLLRVHAESGEAMLRAVGVPELARIVRGHHERLDGSGYPDGLRGLEICDATRLLSVADAYDAMRAGRPYAPAIEHAVALQRLEDAPHLFDRDAVAALVRALEAATAFS